MKIKVKYSEGVEEIVQAHEGEWYDLRAEKSHIIWKGEYMKISLGVAIELPEGYEAIVVPRSSTFEKHGIIMVNGFGVIDHSYCGNDDVWHFPALKVYGEPAKIQKNERIAQFRIQKCQPECELVTVDSLSDENRGGFGSTGRS